MKSVIIAISYNLISSSVLHLYTINKNVKLIYHFEMEEYSVLIVSLWDIRIDSFYS